MHLHPLNDDPAWARTIVIVWHFKIWTVCRPRKAGSLNVVWRQSFRHLASIGSSMRLQWTELIVRRQVAAYSIMTCGCLQHACLLT